MILKITANYPTDEIKGLIKLAYKCAFSSVTFKLPTGFKVWVKNCRDYAHAGRFYGNKISLRIGTPNKFPLVWKYPNLKSAPEYTLSDWKEGLFALSVHEFWHYVQMKTYSPYSEIETERFVVTKLDQFRSKFRIELEEKLPLSSTNE